MGRNKYRQGIAVTSTAMKRFTVNMTLSNIPTKRLRRQRMKLKSFIQRFKANLQRRIKN
jgi:hypothetical protein